LRLSRVAVRAANWRDGAFQSGLCGSAMTMSRAADLGYDIENKCPLCGEPGDTVRHRTFFCRCTAQAVQAAVPRWFIDEAVRSSPRDSFWTTGVIPHPAELAPQLATEVEIVVEHGLQEHDGRQAEAPSEGGGADTSIGGRIYIDGSAQPSVIDGLGRAGACVAEVDEHGNMIKKLTCVVPAHLPQTSQAAEHLAAAIAFRCINRRAIIYGDCLGVVRALNDQGGVATFAKKRYGGLLLDTVRDPARKRLCQGVQWVKAHRHEANAEDAEDLINIKGNAIADKGADEAVKQHASLGTDLRKDIEFWEKGPAWLSRRWVWRWPCFPQLRGI
jgi:ribonuclease HI